MASITIHSLDPALEQALSEESRRKKQSKNSLVKELLASSLGLPVEGRLGDEYREFCGLWTAEERQTFEATLRENSEVDADDWRP